MRTYPFTHDPFWYYKQPAKENPPQGGTYPDRMIIGGMSWDYGVKGHRKHGQTNSSNVFFVPLIFITEKNLVVWFR